jgi:hypothetical protein
VVLGAAVSIATTIVAAILAHYLHVRRLKLEMRDREFALFDAAKEELRYAIRELEFLQRSTMTTPLMSHYNGYEGQPPFVSRLVRQLGPESPISPRVIVTLNSLFDDVESVGRRIRSGNAGPRDTKFLSLTLDHALEVYAAYSKVDCSLDVPGSASITDADVEEAREKVGFIEHRIDRAKRPAHK